MRENDDTPARLGRYLVIDRLGAGAMGVVYAAYDPQLDRKVAVKLLQDDRTDAEAHVRMLREAQAMAQLNHPNVVAVHDAGVHEGRVYLAMDFIRGEPLRTWLAPRRRWRQILAMFTQAGRGLAAAHEAGLVHRDFKPDNVLVDEKGRGLVADFGLAHAVPGTGATTSRAGPSGALQVALTQHGALLGTPAYMAAEQFYGAKTDARTDQFAFCVALWEALFGERPFAGDDLVSLAIAVKETSIREPPRARRVPRWLRQVVRRGLAATPDARWPSMDRLLEELARGQARARLRVGLGGVAVLGLLALGMLGLDRHARGARAAECERSADAIYGDWHDDARAQIREAFDATGASIAHDTFLRVTPRLDDWAAAWREQRAAACVASSVEGTMAPATFEQASACLDELRDAFLVTLDVLAHADSKTVQRAAMMAAGLSRPSTCTDERELSRRAVPNDEATRTHLAVLRRDLARARGLEVAGRYQDAMRLVEGIVVRADELGFLPFRAEATTVLGSIASEFDSKMAETVSKEGFLLALESGIDERIALSASILLRLESKRPPYESARWWARVAESALGDGEGVGDLVRATYYGNVAGLEFALRNYEAANAAYVRAIELQEPILGHDHPRIATALASIGLTLDRLGRTDESLGYHQSALEIRERLLGADHPEVASSLVMIGAWHTQKKEYAKAEACHRRALEIRERTFGRDHVSVAVSLGELARALEGDKRLEDATTALTEAVAILEKSASDDRHLSAALTDLGRLETAGGHARAALPRLERALALREKSGDSMMTGKTRFHMAKALWAVGEDLPRAQELAVQARDELRAALSEGGADAPESRELEADVETWISQHEHAAP